MAILTLFAFLAGIVTILSPCILPVLPFILSSSAANPTSKLRPLGVIAGFVASFTLFTLFLSTIVKLSGIPADTFRYVSIVILALFGFSLVYAPLQAWLEMAFSRLTRFAPQAQGKQGFGGGLILGLSLGLLWTPCVGPILASVISLALIGDVTVQAFIITLAYSLGTAIPMFIIMISGATALQKVPWLKRHSRHIQQAFGVVMIVTSMALVFGLDRQFQAYILKTFPQYGTGLTQLEDNELVEQELKQTDQTIDSSMIGKPSDEMNNPLPRIHMAPEIVSGGEWFNSQPLTLEELKGKVVLIDFWTYSCINCQRTLPYLKSWQTKYGDEGLVIIGVHTPEFAFEREAGNVSEAIQDFGIEYPVVQDNDFATWQAFRNRYWPAKYLIDSEGYIRYTHFGEGEYDETERAIQQLLKEAGAEVSAKVDNPSYTIDSQTPETYLGYARIKGLSSPELVNRDAFKQYSPPETLYTDRFALAGQWNVHEEYAQPRSGGRLTYRFQAKDVFLVMNPTQDTARVKVYLDGQAYAGADADEQGVVSVSRDALYHLISLPEAGVHTLELEFLDDNSEIYAFTFG